MKIRTLIVDDEPLARERLRTLLEGKPDIEIVGECDNGADALEVASNEKPGPDLPGRADAGSGRVRRGGWA